jgi:uncharacterized protein involved in cysteine biosynthesis
MVFHIIPTALEISLVCGILVSFFSDLVSVRLSYFPDMAIWLQICSNHGCDHGRLLRLHYSDNILED